MRKMVFVCDRCSAEIDGLPAQVEIQTIRESSIKDLEPITELADVEELARLFPEQADREAVRSAMLVPYDLCADCVKEILRTLISKPSEDSDPNAPKPEKKRGRPAKAK